MVLRSHMWVVDEVKGADGITPGEQQNVRS